MAYLLYTRDTSNNIKDASFLEDAQAQSLIRAYGLATGETISPIADSVTIDSSGQVDSITIARDGIITDITYKVNEHPAYTAGVALTQGLVNFGQWLQQHSAGVESSIVNKIHDALWRFHQGNRLIAADTSFTKAQKQAIFSAAQLGPNDITIVDASGNFVASGLFPLFQKVNDRAALNAPSTYVGLNTRNWASDGTPNRLTVANIASVSGTVDAIIDTDDLSWLDGLK